MTRAHRFIDYGDAPPHGRATDIVITNTNGIHNFKFSASIAVGELAALIEQHNLGIRIEQDKTEYVTCRRNFMGWEAEIRIKANGGTLEFSTINIDAGKRGSIEVCMLKDMRAAILGEVVQREELANAASCLFRGGRPDTARMLLKAIGISNPEEVGDIKNIYRKTFSGSSGEKQAQGFARALIRRCMERADSGEIRKRVDEDVRALLMQVMGELSGVNEYTPVRYIVSESGILQIRRR